MQIHKHTYKQRHMYTYAQISKHTYIHIYKKCIHAYVNTYTFTHICQHSNTQIYNYVYINLFIKVNFQRRTNMIFDINVNYIHIFYQNAIS